MSDLNIIHFSKIRQICKASYTLFRKKKEWLSMGSPAYSLLVLFLSTFYNLTKQENCSKYVPNLYLLFRLHKGAQGDAQAKNVNSLQHLNLEVKSGFCFWRSISLSNNKKLIENCSKLVTCYRN